MACTALTKDRGENISTVTKKRRRTKKPTQPSVEVSQARTELEKARTAEAGARRLLNRAQQNRKRAVRYLVRCEAQHSVYRRERSKAIKRAKAKLAASTANAVKRGQEPILRAKIEHLRREIYAHEAGTVLEPRRVVRTMTIECEALYEEFKRLRRMRTKCERQLYLLLAQLPRRYWLTAVVSVGADKRVHIYFSDTSIVPAVKDPKHGHVVLLNEVRVYVRLTSGKVVVRGRNHTRAQQAA